MQKDRGKSVVQSLRRSVIVNKQSVDVDQDKPSLILPKLQERNGGGRMKSQFKFPASKKLPHDFFAPSHKEKNEQYMEITFGDKKFFENPIKAEEAFMDKEAFVYRKPEFFSAINSPVEKFSHVQEKSQLNINKIHVGKSNIPSILEGDNFEENVKYQRKSFPRILPQMQNFIEGKHDNKISKKR